MISLERRGGRPLRIGHRGAAALAPENTLQSFRAALEAGVDLIEFDLLQLQDGNVVVAHSDDLHEVSHGAATGTVRSWTLEKLHEVCPELPTLDDALEFFAEEARDVGAHVDLKSASAVAELAVALRRFGLVERSFVSSFHVRALRQLVNVEPGVRVGVSFPRDIFGAHGRTGLSSVVRLSLRSLRLVTPLLAPVLLERGQASAFVLHHSIVSTAAVRRAHRRGAAVVAWTVDDAEDLARVDEAGVDAVVSNDPRIFASTLET